MDWRRNWERKNPTGSYPIGFIGALGRGLGEKEGHALQIAGDLLSLLSVAIDGAAEPTASLAMMMPRDNSSDVVSREMPCVSNVGVAMTFIAELTNKGVDFPLNDCLGLGLHCRFPFVCFQEQLQCPLE